MPPHDRAAEISLRIYRWLLWAYPRAFRQECGDEMTLLFQDLLAAELRQRGWWGLFRFWPRIICDLARSTAAQRIRQLERSLTVLMTHSRLQRYWIALIVALTIAMILTPADPLSQCLAAAPMMIGFVIWDRRRERKQATGGVPQ